MLLLRIGNRDIVVLLRTHALKIEISFLLPGPVIELALEEDKFTKSGLARHHDPFVEEPA